MTDTVTVRGYIATAPTQKYLPKTNVPVANFRLASTPRWFDNTTGQWREGDTNWYSVNTFRALAHNSARSLQVGQPILVTGRLKVKQFERADGSQGTSIEIDATSIGHDLNYGLARFERISDRRPEMDETDRKFNAQIRPGGTSHQTQASAHPYTSGNEGNYQEVAVTQEIPGTPLSASKTSSDHSAHQVNAALHQESGEIGDATHQGLVETVDDEVVMAMTS